MRPTLASKHLFQSIMSASIAHLPRNIDVAKERNHFYETLWKQVGLDLLERHCGSMKGLSLLDYGCGRGETLKLAKERGLDPLGTDVDPDCVNLSSAHGPAIRLEHPNDPLSQFGEKSYDVVTCFHVLEHVDRPKETLAALGKIARKHVIVAVPNLRSVPRPRFLRREPLSVNEGHLQGWDHAHFRNLAELHCGLRVVDWGHDHGKLPGLSQLAAKWGGNDFAIRMETGPFLKFFTFHCASIIALMEPLASSSDIIP